MRRIGSCSLYASLLLVAAALVPSGSALADPPCGAVDVRFKPGAANMQIVVWVEDGKGKFVDTPYVTRLTGQFGLANRPGTPLLKTDFRWPYGRREMVAPIWAHHRDHHYPKVSMGGVCGASSGGCKESSGWTDNSPPSMCPGGGTCGCDCADPTIAYHSRVSSYEPFYCSPSGASKIDAMSCASKGTFSKGAYLPFPQFFSLYPPRADLNGFDKFADSPDVADFAKKNDLVAVSQATPPANKVIDPALVWFPQNLAEGDYTAWIELSQESDFNANHNHPAQADVVSEWDFEGHPFLGQPSVVYKVPFKYVANGYSAISTAYAGYSTWDGSDGVLHAPDNTITDKPGTGAGRLVDVNDGIDVFRVKVVVGACVQAMPDAGTSDDGGPPPVDDGGLPISDGGPIHDAGKDGGIIITPMCNAPSPVTDLALAHTSAAVTVSFKGPTTGVIPNRFAVRYREGDTPIPDTEFNNALAAPSIAAGASGDVLSTTITGLIAKTSYAVAVRGIAPCGTPSPVASSVIKTDDQKFTTLSGCFIATAAYGSALESHVATLRAFRDRHLLTNSLGRVFVATYYTFGPPLARAISPDPALRSLARAALTPLLTSIPR